MNQGSGHKDFILVAMESQSITSNREIIFFLLVLAS